MKVVAAVLTLVLAVSGAAFAQEPASRTEAIEQAEQAKSDALKPATPGKAEAYVARISDAFLSGQMHWHAFWQNAYSGGGFTLGAGYTRYVSSYNWIDVRGSVTFSGYKRLETEFFAPDLFKRRGTLSVIGGWREATQVNFFGIGQSSSQDALVNYGFTQPYVNARLEVFPTRGLLDLRGGFELSQWKQGAGSGSSPSIETIYTPATLPGLGASPVYLHTQGTVGIDSRPARGYTRRGGFYGVTVHDYTDTANAFGFEQVDYEALQHIPILREAWVLAFRAFAQTTYDKSGQVIPFFMMPSFSGGSDLRAYASWRLRDLNSLLVQGEWRANVNRFLEMALFYDAGKVTQRRSDLTLGNMKTDVGIGFRFHGPISTPLRIELAKGSEGIVLNFSASQVF
ncbi:MAG TPA: hypothetical protein VNG89_10310 [Vicinamibacterales bacterium]|nr:hypothetical protein [Vicinamibacterales bacterium]